MNLYAWDKRWWTYVVLAQNKRMAAKKLQTHCQRCGQRPTLSRLMNEIRRVTPLIKCQHLTQWNS